MYCISFIRHSRAAVPGEYEQRGTVGIGYRTETSNVIRFNNKMEEKKGKLNLT